MGIPATAALLALSGACLAPTARREDTLVREARTFNDDLRWARYDQLSASLPADEAQRFLARAHAVGDDLVLADYEVTSINFAPNSQAATVAVTVQWYSRSATTLHSTTLEQRWEVRDGRWLVARLRRVRGDRFPLVAEPVTPAPRPAP
jgi:hypothetical protein